MKLTIDKDILIDAPVSKVWRTLTEEFGSIGEWATIVPSSQPRISTDGELIGRTCHTTYGDLTESLLDLNQEDLTFTYDVHGMPSMIQEALNTWKLVPIGANQTKVVTAIRMKISPIQGAIMGWMMSLKLNKDIGTALTDLKTYVETGVPSAAKQRALAKQNKKEKVAA